MSLVGFIKSIMKKDFLTIGWIPEKGIKYQVDRGWYYLDKNGFILFGSPKKEYRHIHIFYVFPNKRGSNALYELEKNLPEKAWLQCVTGLGFWKRRGFAIIKESEANQRSRKKYTMIRDKRTP